MTAPAIKRCNWRYSRLGLAALEMERPQAWGRDLSHESPGFQRLPWTSSKLGMRGPIQQRGCRAGPAQGRARKIARPDR